MPLLTVRALDALKPKERPYKVTDERGLHLRIAPDGTRTLLVRYTVKGSCGERRYRMPRQYGEGVEPGITSTAGSIERPKLLVGHERREQPGPDADPGARVGFPGEHDLALAVVAEPFAAGPGGVEAQPVGALQPVDVDHAAHLARQRRDPLIS